MINCPICHVLNADDARFCAECGQRLTPPSGPQQSAASQSPNAQSVQPAVEPPKVEPPLQPAPRLHSPLLAATGAEAPMMSSNTQTDSAAEVNRLKMMASKQQDRPAQQPYHEQQFKNPFDPRNDQQTLPVENSKKTAPQSERPAVQPKSKLRSPLLAGEDFDDDEYFPVQEGAEESPSRGSSHLHSPLLDGGGNDRRRQQSPQTYVGQERRGLRSPMLGGGSVPVDDYDDEAEPLEENDPNVLRSPLLAARRSVDRAKTTQPADQNTAPDEPPAFAVQQTPDAFAQQAGTTWGEQSQQLPQAEMQAPINNLMNNGPASGWNQTDSYQFTDMQAPWPQTAATAVPIARTTPQYLLEPEVVEQPHVQPPAKPQRAADRKDAVTHAAPLSSAAQLQESRENLPAHSTKSRSRILSGYADDENVDQDKPITANNRFTQEPVSSSPIPKIIGGLALVLIIVEAFNFMGLMSDPGLSRTSWLVNHYIVVLGGLMCVALLGFTSKR